MMESRGASGTSTAENVAISTGLAVLGDLEVFPAEPANRPSGLVGHDDVDFDDGDAGLEAGLRWRRLLRREQQQNGRQEQSLPLSLVTGLRQSVQQYPAGRKQRDDLVDAGPGSCRQSHAVRFIVVGLSS